MKTTEIVTRHNGWYVTRRISGLNAGAMFFPFGKTKKSKNAAEKERNKYIAEWESEN